MKALCLALCLVLASCASPTRDAKASIAAPGGWTGSLVVRTAFGDAKGHPDKLDTIAWEGLPYAAPPTGELRWRAPQDPEPWSGVLDAAGFGPSALQFRPLVGGLYGSEDCLYLNVWRPASTETGLPVYVYIHGGGNTTGSAGMVSDYHGYGVAGRSKFVFVSMNYRLGPLGWFLSDAVTGSAGDVAGSGEGDSASGNFGSLDIIQALGWVKRNIVAFGGDPGKVTIAGESAGAMNVLSLLASSRSAGLFHKAIAESGVAVMTSRESAKAASAKLIRAWLWGSGRAKDAADAERLYASMPAADLARLLRSAKPKDLLKYQVAGVTGMTDWPTIITDGKVMPTGGYTVFATGDYPNKVPLLIGSNKEEMKLFLFLDRGVNWKTPLYRDAARYGSMIWKAGGVDEIADALASRPDQPPVFVYRFDWGAPDSGGVSSLPGSWGGKLGAFHSLEIPFFLGTGTCLGPLLTGQLFTKANEAGREALGGDIMTWLAAFVRHGDPNAGVEGLPYWPRRPPRAAEAAAAGESVGIVLDADRAGTRFSPLLEVLTKASVYAEMDANLSPDAAAAVRSRLFVR